MTGLTAGAVFVHGVFFPTKRVSVFVICFGRRRFSLFTLREEKEREIKMENV